MRISCIKGARKGPALRQGLPGIGGRSVETVAPARHFGLQLRTMEAGLDAVGNRGRAQGFVVEPFGEQAIALGPRPRPGGHRLGRVDPVRAHLGLVDDGGEATLDHDGRIMAVGLLGDALGNGGAGVGLDEIGHFRFVLSFVIASLR